MNAERKLTRGALAGMSYPFVWPPQSVMNPGENFLWAREVVFDFHEVCVKWVKQFVEFLNQTYGYDLNPNTIDFYNMQFDPSLPLSPEQFDEAFVTFARLSAGGYGDLEAHPGIRETMEKIKNAGIEVKIWTWTPGAADRTAGGYKSYGSGMAQRVTRELIQKLGLPVDVDRDVRFLHPSQKKWKMAEDHIPLLIEDNPETAVSVGLGTAQAVILVPEKYNEDLLCKNVLPLNERKDLADTVIDFYAKLDAAGLLL